MCRQDGAIEPFDSKELRDDVLESLKKAYQSLKRILFLRERSGNVYENKGPAVQRRAQAGNVTENKGSYALKAGMLLKTKEVGCGS